MSNPLFKLYTHVDTWLWSHDLRDAGQLRRTITLSLRTLVVLIRQFLEGELNLRAMSLVYTTLLSVVPLLAVSFSVLKGFGVHNQLEPVLLNFLEPLGPDGVEVADNIIRFVENVEVGVLGSLGFAFLIYAVVSLTQKIEAAFNFVWQVDRLRGLTERFSNYLSVILVGPLLMFTAVGLSAAIVNADVVQQLIDVEAIGFLLFAAGKLLPFLLVVGAFTFLYVFIPNTQVKLVPALLGGVVAGLLWEGSGWVFAQTIATSSKYSAIYSSFAILILLLIWLYLNWLILLMGSQVAFYVQHPQYVTREPVRLHLSNRLQERLTLQLMFLVADSYLKRGDLWTLDGLVHFLRLPMQPVHQVLRVMLDAGFISETSAEPPAYLPRRDIHSMTVAELLRVVRSAGENRLLTLNRMPQQVQIDRTMTGIEKAIEDGLGNQTLRDLVEQSPENGES
ncbi:MAG: YihY/virulence factor BrkB family protein [Thiogranum sp.]|nr:YihY/virulence factor BrkB family protein [Thiogranum sp.]